MGHKVHPIGFRIGVIRDWKSKWYSETHYAEFVQEDNKLRKTIMSKYPDAAISLIEIDRQAKDITITLYTARPGIVIGRGGQRVDEMRQFLEGLIGKKIRLNIQEIRQPELDAYLVAKSVAEQIERRVAYRRAMKQAIFRTMQSGAKGIKISAAGRLANAEIARRQTLHEGQVPLHTLRADVDYGFTEAHTTLGRIGVKVWIYKGQILPELKIAEVEEKPAEEEAETTEAPSAEEKPTEAAEKEAAVAEEKPAKEVAAAEVKEKPAKPAKAAPAKAEAKPAKKAAAAEVEEKPAKPTKAAPAKAEAKPAKPKAKKAIKKAETKEPAAKVTKAKAPKAKATEIKAQKTKTKAKAEKTEKEKAPAKKPQKKAAAAKTEKETSKKTKTVAKSKKEAKDAAA
ncbi:MAG: 30S ribosomal protein S3 [Dehalococcoidales bacterium]|nr:30S ribosomal protein S3 [Dehalococcoidales bacterium]